MLSPYRSIGQFSTHVGHQIRYHSAQKVPIVVCPIGNVFISYYVDRPEIGHLGGIHLVQCHLGEEHISSCNRFLLQNRPPPSLENFEEIFHILGSFSTSDTNFQVQSGHFDMFDQIWTDFSTFLPISLMGTLCIMFTQLLHRLLNVEL